MNRRTSAYTFSVQTAYPNVVLDRMRRNILGFPLAASGVDASRAFIRFRAANDDDAVSLAEEIAGVFGGTLTLDYGVNRRVVAEISPDGPDSEFDEDAQLQ